LEERAKVPVLRQRGGGALYQLADSVAGQRLTDQTRPVGRASAPYAAALYLALGPATAEIVEIADQIDREHQVQPAPLRAGARGVVAPRYAVEDGGVIIIGHQTMAGGVEQGVRGYPSRGGDPTFVKPQWSTVVRRVEPPDIVHQAGKVGPSRAGHARGGDQAANYDDVTVLGHRSQRYGGQRGERGDQADDGALRTPTNLHRRFNVISYRLDILGTGENGRMSHPRRGGAAACCAGGRLATHPACSADRRTKR
jgi:hypothetical protein